MNNEIVKSEVVINWKDIFFSILRRWWLILLGVVVGAVGGFGLGVLADRPVYESQVAYVLSYSGGDSIASMAQEYSFLNRILYNCVEIAKQNTFVEMVTDEVNEELQKENPGAKELEAKDVAACINYSYSSAGTIIYITVDTPDANLSNIIVTAVDKHFEEHVLSTYGLAGGASMVFNPINTPEPATEPVPSTERTTFTAIGAVALGLLCAVILAGIAFLDNRIKHEEDVVHKYNAPILGTVPNFNDPDLNKGGYERYAAH